MIFFSHSPQDDLWATALWNWLQEQGFQDLFLDLSNEDEVATAYRWTVALVASVKHCEFVVFLVSDAWLRSVTSKQKLGVARNLGKKVALLLIEDVSLDTLDIMDDIAVFRLTLDPTVNLLTRCPQTHQETTVCASADELRRLKDWLIVENRSAKHVFVSFSSFDKAEALAIARELEQAGIKCWISCRDVPVGEDFQDSIVGALEAAGAMVLVFSRTANNSAEIKKELALASEHKLFVLPVRIEDAEPTKGFKYQLATRQYVDLFQDRQKSMSAVVEALKNHLKE